MISSLRFASRSRIPIAAAARSFVGLKRWKSFSSVASQQSEYPQPKPPSDMNEEMAMGIQDATSMYVRYGVGNQRLLEISNSSGETVEKWQRMMEAFLGTQVHVLAGLGYTPDEQGLALYNQQLATLVQSASPELQEALRIKGRDTWRHVLVTAFGLEEENLDELQQEVSIVDARNIMHKVSLKMQEPAILELVSKRCASIPPNDNPKMEMAQKHHIVQEILVQDVYLAPSSDGDATGKTLVEECGFGSGEKGYVKMQSVMAEHQSDALVGQYIGTAMMKLLQAAGLDMQAMQKAAAAPQEIPDS